MVACFLSNGCILLPKLERGQRTEQGSIGYSFLEEIRKNLIHPVVRNIPRNYIIWGYSNMDLMTLYRGATADNECPLMVDKSLPSCGKSRFGCWVCTMVERDKSMEAMIANDEDKAWMTALLEFRNEFGNEDGDRERRSFRRMQGNLSGNYGKLFHGPYKKEVREKWLERLLEIQRDINENGPEEYSKNFFAKKWTNRELDGILAKEGMTGVAPLPIWYNITYEEVYEFSPTLSGLYSMTTDRYTVEDICKAFKLVLEKEPISQ